MGWEELGLTTDYDIIKNTLEDLGFPFAEKTYVFADAPYYTNMWIVEKGEENEDGHRPHLFVEKLNNAMTLGNPFFVVVCDDGHFEFFMGAEDLEAKIDYLIDNPNCGEELYLVKKDAEPVLIKYDLLEAFLTEFKAHEDEM